MAKGLYFIQTKCPSFNGTRYLYIDKPSYNSAENNGNHAPESNRHNSSEFKSGMKKDQYWSERAQKDMKFHLKKYKIWSLSHKIEVIHEIWSKFEQFKTSFLTRTELS